MTEKQEKIKLSLLLPVAFAILALVGSSITGVYWLGNHNISYDAKERLSGVERMIHWQMKHDASLLHSIANVVVQDKALEQAWNAKDWQSLSKRAGELLDALQEKHNIERFTLYRPDLTCELRVHEPAKFGDKEDWITLTHAALKGEPTEDIHLDDSGVLTLRSVDLWKIDGKVVGYIELGEKINHITPELKKTLKAELVFTANKSYLDRKKWEKSNSANDPDDNWDSFGHFVVVEHTMNHIPEQLVGKIRYTPSQYGTVAFAIEEGQNSYRGGFLKFKDNSGQDLGDVIVLIDVTEMKKSQMQMLTTIAILCSTVAIILFVLFFFHVRRIEMRLIEHRSKLETEIQERKRTEEELMYAKTRAEQAQEEARQTNRQLKNSVERANRLADQAIVADVAKGQFLANMSHEIRTPMNAIIGFSDMLMEGEMSANQKKHINIIRESSKTLLRLINDILDFSKIEAGRLDVELSECRLKKMLGNIELMMSAGAKSKGLGFKVTYKNEIPELINTDSIKLQQCLINVCNNAIKFTQKGHVRLIVSLETVQQEPMLRFDVIDTGIGIPFDKQHMIFEAFSQADDTHCRKYGGTGLGLAITRKMVSLLGGKISVSSSPGEGSTFSIWVPLDTNVGSSRRDNHDDSDTQEKFSGKILVAEDTPTNQLLIRLLLQKLGFDVTIAQNGKEAVEAANNDDSFDLIFMDMHMPEMNGYEAVQTLRKKGLLTPIIALTACAMKGDEQKCIDCGCNAYLPKPIERKVLIGMLKKFLSIQKNPTNPVGAGT
ncbi:MAG: ATP-binding protein [Phycisphaerae bacterium]|jgi:signal transduction histidine kinase/CheY-like chemotaxis protein